MFSTEVYQISHTGDHFENSKRLGKHKHKFTSQATHVMSRRISEGFIVLASDDVMYLVNYIFCFILGHLSVHGKTHHPSADVVSNGKTALLCGQ